MYSVECVLAFDAPMADGCGRSDVVHVAVSRVQVVHEVPTALVGGVT